MAIPMPRSPTDALSRRRMPMSNLSVPDNIASRARGGSHMSNIVDSASGKRLSQSEATARMPKGGFNIALPEAEYGPRRSTSSSGDGKIHGYSFNKQGSGADYIRRHGGLSPARPSLLNEGYRNQPGVTMGTYDRLQAQKAMDESDPEAAFYADQAGVARGQGEFDKASHFQNLLQNRLAQGQAGGGGEWSTGWKTRTNPDGSVSGVPDRSAPPAATPEAMGDASPSQSVAAEDMGAPIQQVPEYHSPGETREDAEGNTWRWNEQLGRGEMIRGAMENARNAMGPDSPQETWVEGENLGEGDLYTKYGSGSVTQDEVDTTFTDAQGSAMGGNRFTGERGTQSAMDFFQGAANRTGEDNRFAAPAPGYGGIPNESAAWGAYRSAMDAKKRLKA